MSHGIESPSLLPYKKCVSLSGLSITKAVSSTATNGGLLTHYYDVSYGKNIHISSNNVDIGNGQEIVNCINLFKSKKTIIAIVADKDKCLSMVPNTFTIPSSLHEPTDNQIKVQMSGKLLLMFAILPNQCTDICAKKSWNKNDYIMVQKCKPNIMNLFHHHGSTGKYFAFGNKGSFGTTNKSSIGSYSNKTYCNPQKKLKVTMMQKNWKAGEL